ncbi:hypothetical protein [Burkholderia alba]|uniref:hypothetical protein n=1 Tax=Burkholderia alba TaxID=2683677 RepID=UPI002B05AC50|nr:hypothetical protein [Burkholderia alba]
MSNSHRILSYGSIPAEIDAVRPPSINALPGDVMPRFAVEPVTLDGSRLLSLRNTGGTTGLSKGAVLSDFMIDAENSRVANPKVIKTSIDTLKTARPAAFLGIDPLYAGHASHPRLKEVGRSRMKPTAGGGSTMIDAVSARWKAATCIASAKATVSRKSHPVTCAAVQPVAHRRATCPVGLPAPLADVALLDDNDE